MASFAPSFTGMEPYSDAQVVEMVLQGRREMFELLMRRYNQRLFRAARAILKNDAEAEDVMADAYVRAYMNLASFRRESSFATWLTRIAVHEALARARRLRSQESFDELGSGVESQFAAALVSPELSSAHSELRSALESLIDILPAAYRSVFVLRYAEGLSVKETAESLQISEEAVKMRSVRARGLLRRQLKQRLGVVSSEIFPLRRPICDTVVTEAFRRIRIAGER